MTAPTNEELRLRIANAKGYVFFIDGHHGIVTKHTNPFRSKEAVQVERLEVVTKWQCPDWPEDMTSAWTLIDEMMLTVFGVSTTENHADGYICTVHNPDGTNDILRDYKSMPRAICLAWLAWKETHNDPT